MEAGEHFFDGLSDAIDNTGVGGVCGGGGGMRSGAGVAARAPAARAPVSLRPLKLDDTPS